MVARRLKLNSMSYRLGFRILGGESITSVPSGSNSDAISRSRATCRLCRKTVCREGVWPVKKVADGPRENADNTPSNHVFFIVAIILNTGDGNPASKDQWREDVAQANKSAAKEGDRRGCDAEAQSSRLACQKQTDKDHRGKGRGRMARGKRSPTVEDFLGVSSAYML